MKTLFCTLFALGISATSLHAETAFEYIFATGKAENLPAGEVFHYTQTRNDPKQNLLNDQMDLTIETSDEDLTLTLTQGEKTRRLGQYPKSVGNPIHMYFLETFISDMQADAGGSGFYIRNRLKEALSTSEANPQDCADDMAGKCVILKPFEDDEAREKMGKFADIEMIFRIDEQNPLWVVGIEAQNPDAPDQYQFELELE